MGGEIVLFQNKINKQMKQTKQTNKQTDTLNRTPSFWSLTSLHIIVWASVSFFFSLKKCSVLQEADIYAS